MPIKSLIDEFFGTSAVDATIKSEAARAFFAEHKGMRQEKAREALKDFEKLPEKLRAVIFERAKVEPQRLFMLKPKERVRLWECASKLHKDLAEKAEQAAKARASLYLLIQFKGDDL